MRNMLNFFMALFLVSCSSEKQDKDVVDYSMMNTLKVSVELKENNAYRNNRFV